MFHFSIINVGQYTELEKNKQVVPCCWLTFYKQGAKYFHHYWPDGTLNYSLDASSPANLSVACPNMIADYKFGKERENWVITLEGFPMRIQKYQLQLCIEGDWVKIPNKVDLSSEEAARWEFEIKKIARAFNNPIPENKLFYKSSLSRIIAFMLSKEGNQLGHPARRLKNFIDEDTSFHYSLEELSKKCGYSTDHIRVLFKQEFHITPKKYREQKRMQKAMQLISESQLSIKEIAYQCGFYYLSHFTKAFRNTFHQTPRDAIKHFRY
ncbi:MAG: AraC family transcriptional regulator [Lentisphaeria bacterium]|nr:AraC family transcriptional regulator [Lentisphaeria bacterium]